MSSTPEGTNAAPPAGDEPAIRTIRSLEDLESLGDGWDALVRGMPRPSPFLLHGWLTEWWRHFGSGASLAVVVARRDGRLVGALPIAVRRRGPSRVARFLGGHESALADLLLAQSEPASTGTRLTEELRKEPFDYVDLFGLPRGSLLARASGTELRVIERVSAPVMLMPSGWPAAYEAKTNSRRRNLHRRRLRQLEEQGEVEVSVARTGAELDPMLDEAFRLHDLRWRGRPDLSTFGTTVGKTFHRAALRRLGDQGVVRLVVLSVGGRAVAFDCVFVIDHAVYLYRLGFDPDPALARFSPGLLATLETLRLAGEEGVKRVEFLGGRERYKIELADEYDPMLQGLGLGHNIYGRLAARQRLGLIRLRMRLRDVEPLHALYAKGGLPPFRTRR